MNLNLNHSKFIHQNSIRKAFEIFIYIKVNKQLYTQMERKQLNDLVNTMISYNLTYRQEKNEDGNYVYVLEPLVVFIV